jgi:crossover junction endodeoxyribonuclease RusA
MWQAKAQRANVGLVGPLVVDIFAHVPDRRKRDLDNLWKVLGDALTKAGVWKDDSQIWELHLKRGPVFAGGKVEVVILELEGIV